VAPTPLHSIRPSVKEFNWIDFTKEKFSEGIEQLMGVLDSYRSCTFGSRLDAEIDLLSGSYSWTFPLFRHAYYFGRNPQAEFDEGGLIKFEESRKYKPLTSRNQATLARINDRWHVADGKAVLDREPGEEWKISSFKPSTNGTTIDGFEVPQGVFIPLRNGCEISFSGRIKIMYKEIYSEFEVKVEDKQDQDLRDTSILIDN
ncbi:MAG: FHA domain-containing protein, partial [Coleofasciculaceae cyanobacterium]